MEKKSCRFPKASRLHLKKDIDLLFTSGKQIRNYPLNVVYRFISGEGVPIKIAVSVPKKTIRLAVDRNRIKRQVREAYRTNCHDAAVYFETKNINLQLMFIYTGKVSPEYAVLKSKIILILQRLVKEHEENAV